MTMSNIEASRLVLEKMKAMSVEETLERMAECRGSDFSLAMEQLLSFSADSHLTYKQQHLDGWRFQEPTHFHIQKQVAVNFDMDMTFAANEELAA